MYNTIYLSPHLDDVALSCGGQVYQQTEGGEPVLVVTLAAGWPQEGSLSDFARFLHHVWGLDNDAPAAEVVAAVVRARRAEDAAACRRLGADFQHWDLPDCIYRRHPQTGEFLYTMDEAIFGQLHPAEEELIEQLALRLGGLPPAGRVLAPLTIGNHVDHQITRAAAERVFAGKLWYYEDYPYVQRRPQAVAEVTNNGRGWAGKLIPLSEAAVRARLDAALCYESQVSTLFGDAQTMVQKMRAQIETAGGERVWQRTK